MGVVFLEAVRGAVAAGKGEEKAVVVDEGAAAGDEGAADAFRHGAVMPADAEEIAPGVGHGPAHPFSIGKKVRDCGSAVKLCV